MSGEPTILALIPDLMAEVRFSEAMRAAGLRAEVLTAAQWAAAFASVAGPDAAAASRPTLAVVDLTAPGALAAVETAVGADVPVLAYGPHVDGDALGAAREAGAALVVPRGRFARESAPLVTGLLQARVPPDREAS